MSRQEVGKIALRREGKWWVAYYDIGKTPIELARVLMHIAEGEPQVKLAFIQFTKLMVGRIISEVTGEDAKFGDPEPAPENERSGNA